VLRCLAKTCSHFEQIIVGAYNVSSIGFAQAAGRFDQRIKHDLQIESRLADDLEHVSGGSLLLQGFAQFGEQACVLYGNGWKTRPASVRPSLARCFCTKMTLCAL